MKKTGAIIRIIVWTLVAVLLATVMIAVIEYKENGGSDDFIVGLTGTNYKNPESYLVGGASLNETVSSVEVDWLSGEVNIVAYDGNEIVISETEVDEDGYKLRYKIENGKLIIHYEKSGWQVGIISKPKKTLSVKIPQGMAKNFSELEIDSTSADVNISGFMAETIEIDNTSGEISLENIVAKEVDISTVSGDVTLNGSVVELDCDSTSGKLEVITKTVITKFECNSISGDITLKAPENTGFTLEFDSVSGDFNTDFPTVQRGGKYICGDGMAEFDIDTTSGDLKILTAK